MRVLLTFLLQLAITAGIAYAVSNHAWEHGYYNGPPSDLIAAFLIPFIAYQVVRPLGGVVIARLAALALLAPYCHLLLYGDSADSFFRVYPLELALVGVAAVLAIVLPGGAAHRKLRTGASKAAIARGEEWAWEGQRFALHVDFKAATVRLVARKPLRVWRAGADGKLQPDKASRFDETWPLHQFSLGEVVQRKKDGYIPNRASGWANGELISVTLPGGTHYSSPTGWSDIAFHHRGAHEAPCDYAGLKVATGGAGNTKLVVDKVADREIARFKASWQTVAARVNAAHAAYAGEIKERGDALRRQERERKAAAAAQAEAAEQERVAGLRSAVQAHIASLLDEAGMRGDFRAGTQTEGRLDWLIAADRDGRGLVVHGGGAWQGSLAGAGARIVPGKERCLEIALQDSEYERAHLKKHRLRLMHGAGEDLLQEWCDRVSILGAQATAM